MLQSVIDLQERAINDVISWMQVKDEVTFKAPTGSGKTYMMFKIMERLLEKDKNLVFIISSLSKSDLAYQNHEKFVEFSNNKSLVIPYYIDVEITFEESLYIPLSYNAYSLGRDKYKTGTKLMQGAFLSFIDETKRANKKIILIRDECHQATRRLDELKEKGNFWKILNLSATPNVTQITCEISNKEAIDANLIKKIESSDSEDIHEPLNKLREIKEEYNNGLHINPCLIIQISNKENGQMEFEKIKKILNDEYVDFQWMYITGDTKNNETNSDIAKLPLKEWKTEAKYSKTLDVIIFKMMITEGWDIPRACMLFQVRDSKSKQMDEQVIGRIRRNPILENWEDYNDKPNLQELATTCWVWGIIPESLRRFKKVNVFNERNFKVKTTTLNSLKTKADFNLSNWMSKQNNKDRISLLNIFDLHNKWSKVMQDTKEMCFKYIKNVDDWYNVSINIEQINKLNDSYTSNYEKSMVIGKETAFPLDSYYEFIDNPKNKTSIRKWVWNQIDKEGEYDQTYSFDSEAEKEFADILFQICDADNVELKTWGKNFYTNSNIKFEYCLHDIHSSFPDFILKDKFNRIHIFEVKSVNMRNGSAINQQEYNEKIREIQKCYLHSSKITDQIFYIPIKHNNEWIINKFENGQHAILNKWELNVFIKNKNFND
ncbi:MAG: DEAD/DEAH box helicase family protein [Mycoplasma sp.]|nr:DEAD/DEAH box helicase family protein [Mycoplasma sp.]